MSRSPSPSLDALYLSYDGVLEPIGQSQVLPYLFSLADAGISIQLISFEKPILLRDKKATSALHERLNDHGISWTHLTYHKRPPVLSTAFDVSVGAALATVRAISTKATIVHARSYVPALMALAAKTLTGARFIFDMRGFWPEERVDLGIFRENGYLYRISKWCEEHFLQSAGQIVVLTHRAKRLLESSRQTIGPVEVIPCCVDLARFSRREPSAVLSDRYGLTGKPVIGNLGAVSGRYMVPEMFRLVGRLRERIPALRFIYLTYQDPELVLSFAKREGLPSDCVVVAKAAPDEVPEWLSLFHYGLFFPKPSYSAQAMCPTRLGEFLAAGVPVVTNSGVGDVQDIVEQEGVGIILGGFSDQELTSAARKIASTIPVSSDLREACRSAARTHFALTLGAARYVSIYTSLLNEAGRKLSPAPAATQRS